MQLKAAAVKQRSASRGLAGAGERGGKADQVNLFQFI
jgi:hypothetical protein